MISDRFVNGITRSVFTAGLIVATAGCSVLKNPPPNVYAHNLKHVKCQKNIDGQPAVVEINSTPVVLAHPEDEIIFVCPGDKVRWVTTDSAVDSFTVAFTNKNNPTGLFDPPQDTLASEKGPNDRHTKDQTVASLSSTDGHYKDYLYSIEIKDSAGNVLHKIDPHIIPTGN